MSKFKVDDRVCITNHENEVAYGTICEIYDEEEFLWYRVEIDEESKERGLLWMEDIWWDDEDLYMSPGYATDCDMTGAEELI